MGFLYKKTQKKPEKTDQKMTDFPNHFFSCIVKTHYISVSGVA